MGVHGKIEYVLYILFPFYVLKYLFYLMTTHLRNSFLNTFSIITSTDLISYLSQIYLGLILVSFVVVHVIEYLDERVQWPRRVLYHGPDLVRTIIQTIIKLSWGFLSNTGKFLFILKFYIYIFTDTKREFKYGDL